jgi:hypothetical protein
LADLATWSYSVEDKMHWIGSLPLLIILWGICNGLVLSGQVQEALGSLLFRLALPSQATWSVTLSDLLLFAGVVLLAVEIFRAIFSPPRSSITRSPPWYSCCF